MNFSHALHDYSTNLPTARVILGNYGPIPQLLGIDTKDGGETGRQFAFGSLHPENVGAIQEFRSAVRSVFGDPISAGVQERIQNVPRILDFDISPSMHKALRDTELRNAVEQIMVNLVITHSQLLMIVFAPSKRPTSRDWTGLSLKHNPIIRL